MKCIIIVNIALLVSCCHALPALGRGLGSLVGTVSRVVDKVVDKIDNFTDIIDLSVLGPEVYGYPKKASGLLLSLWTEASLVNPEEVGEYAGGDILMDPPDPGNGLRKQSRRWQNGTVPYLINGTFNKNEKETILAAIADYHELTCTRFVPRTTESDYIVIKATDTGCWSRIGRVGGRQEVNLQRPQCVRKGTVIHELLHVLGYLHEQNRSDRDEFVSINFDNIQPGREHNFRRANGRQYGAFGVSYDYGSVVHYSAYAFTKNSQKTIETKKKNVRIGQRKGLSEGDIRKVNNMYCPSEQ